MAERRMLTKKVTDDDAFMSLSSSAQALYLHLNMAADDDGFCNQVAICMFRAHASVQDLEALLEKRYVYQFENGVIVIRHWRMANALRKDRYTKTIFQSELEQLMLNDNNEYVWLPDGCQMVAERLPDGCQVVATGKDRIGKDRLGQDRICKDNISALLNDSSLSEPVREKVSDFLAYRKELKKPYKSERSIKSLITQVEKQEQEHGAMAVIECINMTIGNQWQGIFWDKIGKPQGNAKGYNRKAQEDYARRMDALDEQNGDTEDSGFYM